MIVIFYGTFRLYIYIYIQCDVAVISFSAISMHCLPGRGWGIVVGGMVEVGGGQWGRVK